MMRQHPDQMKNAVKHLYNRMRDQESRDIFDCRLQYLLNANQDHIWRMIAISDAYQKKRAKELPDRYIWDYLEDGGRKPVILYGAGCNGIQALSRLQREKVEVLCFCDSDTGKQSTVISGLSVISPEQLAGRYRDYPVFITPVSVYRDEILQTLKAMGIPCNNIYLFSPLMYEQYFCPPFITPRPDEIFLDAGCYDGYTMVDFVHFCNRNYQAIYGMEPDPGCYDKTIDTLKRHQIGKVQLIQKGLWSCNTTLRFDVRNNAGSRYAENGNSVIQTVTIDDLFPKLEDAPAFIKMDIEGSELQALEGAQNVIRKRRPRLAVCVYHKNSDILDIPFYLSDLVPEYTYYLRHHSPFNATETVLYAMI